MNISYQNFKPQSRWIHLLWLAIGLGLSFLILVLNGDGRQKYVLKSGQNSVG